MKNNQYNYQKTGTAFVILTVIIFILALLFYYFNIFNLVTVGFLSILMIIDSFLLTKFMAEYINQN